MKPGEIENLIQLEVVKLGICSFQRTRKHLATIRWGEQTQVNVSENIEEWRRLDGIAMTKLYKFKAT